VKLLFDQNLSPRLVQALQKEFPDSRHVREVGLQEATDAVVWQYAAQQGFAIVTKDADFHQRSFLFGHPPKVIWVRVGNASTVKIEALLRRRAGEVGAFYSDLESAFLILD
jgi:predicted nuclease of predicted toxin-antitoxin system